MKRIVADLFVRAHGENHLARRLDRRDVDVAMRESPGLPFFQIGVDRPQVGDEFLSDRVGNRRSVAVEPFESGTQRAFACRNDLVPDGVVVTLAAVLALGLSALIASFVPAFRASSTSPLDALRAE